MSMSTVTFRNPNPRRPREQTPTASTSGMDTNFLDHVANDVRGNLPQEAADALHKHSMAPKRYAALLALKKGVESQLAHQKGRMAKAYAEWVSSGRVVDGERTYDTWLDYRGEQLAWRGKATRFLLTLETHIVAVKEQLASLAADTQGEADYLRELIAAHRQRLEDDDIELTNADVELHTAAGLRPVLQAVPSVVIDD